MKQLSLFKLSVLFTLIFALSLPTAFAMEEDANGNKTPQKEAESQNTNKDSKEKSSDEEPSGDTYDPENHNEWIAKLKELTAKKKAEEQSVWNSLQRKVAKSKEKIKTGATNVKKAYDNSPTAQKAAKVGGISVALGTIIYFGYKYGSEPAKIAAQRVYNYFYKNNPEDLSKEQFEMIIDDLTKQVKPSVETQIESLSKEEFEKEMDALIANIPSTVGIQGQTGILKQPDQSGVNQKNIETTPVTISSSVPTNNSNMQPVVSISTIVPANNANVQPVVSTVTNSGITLREEFDSLKNDDAQTWKFFYLMLFKHIYQSQISRLGITDRELVEFVELGAQNPEIFRNPTDITKVELISNFWEILDATQKEVLNFIIDKYLKEKASTNAQSTSDRSNNGSSVQNNSRTNRQAPISTARNTAQAMDDKTVKLLLKDCKHWTEAINLLEQSFDSQQKRVGVSLIKKALTIQDPTILEQNAHTLNLREIQFDCLTLAIKKFREKLQNFSGQ